MGSQWLGMGRDLLRIDVFKKTFDRCAAALLPYEKDLHHLVTTKDVSIFEDITNSLLAITATQIALTDLLRSMKIFPDRVAGHSLGEVGE